MDQNLIVVSNVVIDAKSLFATMSFAEGIPLNTSQNIEATARVYWLLPEIAEHACFGDDGLKFQDVMGDTELAHLIEHVAVELMARTKRAGNISSGKTVELEEPRKYELQLTCPDDILTSAALTNAIKIVEWAFAGKESDETPDINAIVDGMVYMLDKSFELEEARDTEAANDSLGHVETESTTSAETTSVLPVTEEKIPTADDGSKPEAQTDSAKKQKEAVEEGTAQDGAGAPSAIPNDTAEQVSDQAQGDKASDGADILQFDASKIPGNKPI